MRERLQASGVSISKSRVGQVLHQMRRKKKSLDAQGRKVGKTKRDKGTKIMAVADRNGLPVSVCAESATPHEVTLAMSTLLQMVVPDAPRMTKTIVIHMRVRANLPEDQARAIVEYLNGVSEPLRTPANQAAANGGHQARK